MSAPSAPTLNLNSVPLPRDPSKEEVALLFEHVEKRFPNELGDDRWYLVMVCSAGRRSNSSLWEGDNPLKTS